MTDSTRLSLLDCAHWWLDRGVALVPCQPNSKALVAGFGAHQKRITDRLEAARWFERGRYNLAVVSGSGAGLVVVDFDSGAVFAPWLHNHLDLGTLIESSALPGHAHVFVWDDSAVNAAGAGVEVRARDRVTVVAPSLMGGARYRVLRDAPILRAPVDSLSLLLSTTHPEPYRASAADVYLPAFAGGSLVARVKAARSIVAEARAVLAVSGDELKSSDGGRGRWFIGRCPWHDDKHPSFWVDADRGLFGCHVSGCRAGRGGDVINLRALRYGVDLREAIAELARELP